MATPTDLTVWSRVRPLLPYVMTTVLFAAGVFAVNKLLAPVGLVQVMRQVRGTPGDIIALALLCVAGAYAALIGYDWSTLRHIGKSRPGDGRSGAVSHLFCAWPVGL